MRKRPTDRCGNWQVLAELEAEGAGDRFIGIGPGSEHPVCIRFVRPAGGRPHLTEWVTRVAAGRPASDDRLRPSQTGLLPVLDAGTVGDLGYIVTAWRPSVCVGAFHSGDGGLGRPPMDAAIDLGVGLAERLEQLGSPAAPGSDPLSLGAVLPRAVHVTEDGGVHLDISDLEARLCLGKRTLGRLQGPDIAYVAPEVLENREVSPAADVYCIGAILFDLAAGRPPFSGANDAALRRAVTQRVVVPPRIVNRAVSPELETIILRCMSPDPAARPTMVELAATLRRMRKREGALGEWVKQFRHVWVRLNAQRDAAATERTSSAAPAIRTEPAIVPTPPVAPDLPIAPGLLVEDGHQTDETLRFLLPYPVAALYRLRQSRHEPSAKLGWSFRLAEGVARFLALVGLADVAQASTPSKLHDWFKCIYQPGFGKLLWLLKETASEAAAIGGPFVRELASLSDEWWSAMGRLNEARNRFAHDEFHLADAVAAGLLPALEADLGIVLRGASFLRDYRLGHFTDARKTKNGVRAQWYGSRGLEETEPPVEILLTDLPFDALMVLIDVRDGRALGLAPFFHFGACEADSTTHLLWLQRQEPTRETWIYRHPTAQWSARHNLVRPDGDARVDEETYVKLHAEWPGRLQLGLTNDTLARLRDRVEPAFDQRFRIVGPLGSGGMGTVWQAWDTELNRPCAIKVLHTHLTRSADAMKRFSREARVLARLHHPGIVGVYDTDRTRDGQAVIIMELCEGETLDGRLRREGALPPDAAMAIALQVLEALEEAHKQGVTHRDVKPANVLLTPQGARLIDFGIASVVDETQLTRTFNQMGTMGFMAPEQVVGGPVSAQTDLFGVGRLLLAMLLGRPPTPGEGTDAVANLPKELAKVIDVSTAAEPKLRPTSAAEMIALLQAADSAAPTPDEDEQLSFPNPVHRTRAAAIWPELVRLAKRNEQTTYVRIAKLVGSHQRVMRFPLALIQDHCLRSKLPPLTILVVNVVTRLPGEGFVGWSRDDLEAGRRAVCTHDWSTSPNPFGDPTAPDEPDRGGSRDAEVDALRNAIDASFARAKKRARQLRDDLGLLEGEQTYAERLNAVTELLRDDLNRLVGTSQWRTAPAAAEGKGIGKLALVVPIVGAALAGPLGGIAGASLGGILAGAGSALAQSSRCDLMRDEFIRGLEREQRRVVDGLNDLLRDDA